MTAKAFHAKLGGWNKVISEIIATEGQRRMQRVADAANRNSGTNQYKTGIEGERPLRKRDYRATVFTAGPEAIRDNRRNNTLVRYFHLAGGS